MTAPGQVITATPPAPPTAVSAVPAPPTNMVAPPSAPIKLIDRSLVPVIPPYLNPSFGGTATLSASCAASMKLPGDGTGLGELSAAMRTVQPLTASFGTTGSFSARAALGPGSRAAVSAVFATEAGLRLSNASFGGSCGLSAAVTAKAIVSAAFYSVGSAVGVQPVFATVPFTAAGSLTAVQGQVVQPSGSGTLSCSATRGLSPSGMTKTGPQPTPNTQNAWAQIVNWSPDTTNYPGSVVTSNALVAQGAKASATVSASVAWTPGGVSNTIQIQIKKNNTPIASSTASASSPATASATVPIAVNDLITVEVCDTSMWAGNPGAITAGAGTYVRMS